MRVNAADAGYRDRYVSHRILLTQKTGGYLPLGLKIKKRCKIIGRMGHKNIGSATCLAVDPNANITSMVEDMILKSATEFEKKLDSLVSKIKMLKGQNDTNKPIGTLYFETDFDFSVKLDGSLYSDSEFSINIYDIDAIKRIKCYGGFGSCIESKFDPHISDLLDAVVKDPTEIHSALGGNRGVMWHPQPVNVPKI